MAEEQEAARTPEEAGDTPEPEADSGGEAQPEAAPEAPPTGAPGEGDGPGEEPRPRGRWLLGLVLVLCAVVAGLEAAGLLLTYRLEGRQPPLARAPALSQPAPPAGAEAPPASRFGPDVREVEVVGRVPGPAGQSATAPRPGPEGTARAAEPPPASQPSGPEAEGRRTEPSPAPEPATTRPPRPAAAAVPEPDQASRPPANGRYALQVGIFRSQRYRNDLEARLAELGVPHFRKVGRKRFRSYRLTVQGNGPALERAARVLKGLGYEFERTEGGLAASFFLEEEAQRALEGLVRAGLKGGYASHTGPAPVWTVYAGPFATRHEAEAARKRLAGQGMRAYLRRLP